MHGIIFTLLIGVMPKKTVKREHGRKGWYCKNERGAH